MEKKVNVQMLESQPNNGIRTIDTTSSQTNATPIANCWLSFTEGQPEENETVWLYNRHNKFVALGCRIWVMGDDEDAGWLWALSNGSVYSENGKIVSECESDDNYEFTHWCRLPLLPN